MGEAQILGKRALGFLCCLLERDAGCWRGRGRWSAYIRVSRVGFLGFGGFSQGRLVGGETRSPAPQSLSEVLAARVALRPGGLRRAGGLSEGTALPDSRASKPSVT